MQNQLYASEPNYFRQIVEKSFNAVVILDSDALIQFWNRAAERLFGYAAQDALGKDFFNLVLPTASRESERRKYANYRRDGELEISGKLIEVELIRKDNAKFWADLSFDGIMIEGDPWSFAIIRDTDARKRRELELTQQATTDGLTGLANRREFQRLLEEGLDIPLTLAIIDIDRFKGVNDTFGHPVGDDVIQAFATNLKNHFPDSLCVGRLGGDEFGVILRTPAESENIEASIRTQFEALRESISEGQDPNGDAVTASIGVAIATKSGCTARQLLTAADQMLYASKSAGRNRVSVCVTEL